MGYRDDRDALRSEVDTLQKELESARDDQQRLAGLEERLDAARREVGAIEAELSRAGISRAGSTRAPSRRKVLVMRVMAAVAMCATLGGFLVASQWRYRGVAVATSIARSTPVVPPIVPTARAVPTPVEAAPARRANGSGRRR